MKSKQTARAAIVATILALGSLQPANATQNIVGQSNEGGAHAEWIQCVWIPMRELRHLLMRIA